MIAVTDFLMLLVEDDPGQARLTQEALTRANLVNPLRIVEGADQAVDYLSGCNPYADRRGHPLPSLVLIAGDLPDRGASKLLEWLRSHPKLRSVPTVLLTSASGDAGLPGVSVLVPKPVDV